MDELREYLQTDKKYNLTLVVSTSIEKLQKTTEWISSEFHLSYISINKEISKLLIRKQQTDCSREIIDWISQRINEIEQDPILLTNIDILFEPGFKLDPLAIFKQTSRNKNFLVIWPGEFRNNKLSYATPEHAHYRNWGNPGLKIILV